MQSDLKATIVATFDLMGVDGKTKAPQSQDPIDQAAHEFCVASIGRSYWDKRHANAKDALVKSFDVAASKALEAVTNSVAVSETSTNVSLLSAQFYDVTAMVKIGASYLDTASLKVELMKLLGTVEADALFQRHTKRRNPSVTYIVSETIND